MGFNSGFKGLTCSLSPSYAATDAADTRFARQTMQIHVFVLEAPERCSGMKKRVHRLPDRQAAKLLSFICLQFTLHGHGQFVLFFTHMQLVLPPSE